MGKYLLSYGSRRFAALTLSVLCLLFGVNVTQAATTDSSANATPPDTVGMESFADVAALGQEIAIAQRKIQAMTLKNSLDALEAQQNMGNFSLKVIRVEGFGNNLYAILTDDSGAVYQVGPGDLINKQYRVTSLRPYSVGVVDVNTNRFSVVPFEMGTSMESTSATVSPPAVASANMKTA